MWTGFQLVSTAASLCWLTHSQGFYLRQVFRHMLKPCAAGKSTEEVVWKRVQSVFKCLPPPPPYLLLLAAEGLSSSKLLQTASTSPTTGVFPNLIEWMVLQWKIIMFYNERSTLMLLWTHGPLNKSVFISLHTLNLNTSLLCIVNHTWGVSRRPGRLHRAHPGGGGVNPTPPVKYFLNDLI